MRVSCVDATNHIVHLTGKLKGTPHIYTFLAIAGRALHQNAQRSLRHGSKAGQSGIWFSTVRRLSGSALPVEQR